MAYRRQNRKSGSHIKPRRSRLRRFSILLTIATILMLIGLVEAVRSLNTHFNNKQEHSIVNNSTSDSTGSIAIGSPNAGTISIGNIPPVTTKLLDEINNARTSNGVSPVTEDPLLDQSAQLKLDDMITRNYWAHNTPDGTEPWVFFKRVGYPYREAGENLEYGQYRYQPEQSMVHDWLISPTHRENLLAIRYANIGIAFRKVASFNGEQNVYVIVTHYGTRF